MNMFINLILTKPTTTKAKKAIWLVQQISTKEKQNRKTWKEFFEKYCKIIWKKEERMV